MQKRFRNDSNLNDGSQLRPQGQWFDVNARKPVSGKSDKHENSISKAQSAGYSFGQYDSNNGNKSTGVSSWMIVTLLKSGKKRHRRSGERNVRQIVWVLTVCLMLCAVCAAAYLYGQKGKTSYGIDLDIITDDSASSVSDSAMFQSNETDSSATEMASEEIFALGAEQTVSIEVNATDLNAADQPVGGTAGTGTVISADGYILSDNHVVSSAAQGGYDINITLNDGAAYKAIIIDMEIVNTDITLLRIEAAGLNAVSLGNSSDTRAGQKVYAVSNAAPEQDCVFVTGMIGDVGKGAGFSGDDGSKAMMEVKQFDLQTGTEVTGDPLYNADGKVIGIVADNPGQADAKEVGFAVPVDAIKEEIEKAISLDRAQEKALFGVETRTINANAANYYGLEQGEFVCAVTSGSRAEEAGLCIGDIIVSLGDTDIASSADIAFAIRSLTGGGGAAVTYYRSGQRFETAISYE